ncbi:hypothetical protein H5410_013600 [Solanum commersonii]|uniref:Uncharacterized protein n=1 Tax=Solanum commersonii TaxID=4109 RepID=A0A9J5ZNP2_SOLCO|nr:hypothetical protein H5410_013600 [Solanum commersonii]
MEYYFQRLLYMIGTDNQLISGHRDPLLAYGGPFGRRGTIELLKTNTIFGENQDELYEGQEGCVYFVEPVWFHAKATQSRSPSPYEKTAGAV